MSQSIFLLVSSFQICFNKDNPCLRNVYFMKSNPIPENK